MLFARPLLAASLVGLAAATLAPVAGAQQIYRIVGPDGRVTFSDRAPLETNTRGSGAQAAPQAGGAGSTLPFELRQVAGRFPVTLYTGTNCGPCGSGRALLTSRGIPFVEKTVTSNEDLDALQRLAGDNGLPLLTVGGQQIKGYSDTEWGQFLDAAGYPATSRLPPNFRNPPPSPMVALQRPAAGTPDAAGAADAPASGEPSVTTVNRRAAQDSGSRAPAAPPANPAGITF
jgi:glutaredoxin